MTLSIGAVKKTVLIATEMLDMATTATVHLRATSALVPLMIGIQTDR